MILDDMLHEMGTHKAVADAWPGANLCRVRLSGDADEYEILATVDGCTVSSSVPGHVVRAAIRGECTDPLFEALDTATKQLASRVTHAGNMRDLERLDPR